LKCVLKSWLPSAVTDLSAVWRANWGGGVRAGGEVVVKRERRRAEQGHDVPGLKQSKKSGWLSTREQGDGLPGLKESKKSE
jgi:hypothetical protein